MESEGYFLPVQMAGVTPDKRYTTCYGFNSGATQRAPKDKQEACTTCAGSSCGPRRCCSDGAVHRSPGRRAGRTIRA